MKRKLLIQKILVVTIILSFMDIGIQTISKTNTPILIVTAQETTWNLTLRITETSGKKTSVVLGVSPNASDAQDDLDRPEPPAPPEITYVQAWFTTSLSIPFNRLLQEYKHIPSNYTEWNLSILWVPESSNASDTTISISWDSAKVKQNTFNSFQLFENNTVVADLRTQDSYSFQSNGTLHHFQIIGQSSPTNNTTGQSELPILPIVLSIGVLIIVILIVFFIYHKREERRRMEEVRRRMEEERKMEEKRRMDEERKREKKGETKKKRTKKETGKK